MNSSKFSGYDSWALIFTYNWWILISFPLMHIKLTKCHASLTLVFIPYHNKWNIQRRKLHNKPFVCECRDTSMAHVILLKRLTRELVVNWKLCTHEVLSCCFDNLFSNKYESLELFRFTKPWQVFLVLTNIVVIIDTIIFIFNNIWVNAIWHFVLRLCVSNLSFWKPLYHIMFIVEYENLVKKDILSRHKQKYNIHPP